MNIEKLRKRESQKSLEPRKNHLIFGPLLCNYQIYTFLKKVKTIKYISWQYRIENIQNIFKHDFNFYDNVDTNGSS